MLTAPLEMELPEGVSLTMREGSGEKYYFLMNFSENTKVVTLPQGMKFRDIDSDELLEGQVELQKYAVKVLTC